MDATRRDRVYMSIQLIQKYYLFVSLLFGILLFGCSQNITPTDAPVAHTESPSLTPEPIATHVPATFTPPRTLTNIPTATAIIPGTVLFEEDFEDGKADNFLYIADGWMVTTEANGNKVFEINTNTEAAIKNDEGGGIGFGSNHWANYSAEYRVRMLNLKANTWLSFRSATGVQDYYVEWLSAEWDAFNLLINQSFGWENIKSLDLPVRDERWYRVKVEARGPALRLYLEDSLMIEVNDSRITSGGFNLGVMPGTHAQFDDIRVIALDETP